MSLVMYFLGTQSKYRRRFAGILSVMNYSTICRNKYFSMIAWKDRKSIAVLRVCKTKHSTDSAIDGNICNCGFFA